MNDEDEPAFGAFSPDLNGVELKRARAIDAVCRRFEADWRAGKQPAIDDYLAEVPREGRPALRTELAALERELLQSQEAGATSPATGADAPTMPPTALVMKEGTSSVHEDATLPPPRGTGFQPVDDIPTGKMPVPHRDATVDLGPSASTAPEMTVPTQIRYFGDYEIIREIARGGMGVVYRARQISLNRPVALKMILAGQLAGNDDVKRFYIEAEAAANLDHPGIVPIYEIGEHHSQHFFSMGFVEGTSLAAKVANGPLPPHQAAALLVQISEAVQYAHEKEVIHRDLKPANVLLDAQGHPKITDFGLAKKLQSDSGLTHTGQVMGTPSYMPPEQAEGKKVGPAADVYALGAILYCLLTGRPPFQAATPMDTLIQVVGQDPVPVRQLNATVPKDLETICLKCLEKEPMKRYLSAAACGQDLGRFLAGEPIVARPVRAAERLVKLARRKPAIAALSAALPLVAAVGFTGVLWQWRKALDNLAVANTQRGIAQEKSREATEKAQSLERQLYFNRINLAQREWMANNSFASDEILNRCPPGLRNWEWSYVRRLCHLENLVINGGMAALAFSPDGRRVVSSGRDNRVRMRETIRGDLVSTMTGHSMRVYAIIFSPDGRLLATGSQDTTIKLWDASSGTLLRTLEPHGSWIRSLAFSPDGSRLVSGAGAELFTPNKTAELILWDVATGRELRRFAGPHDRIWGVSFRPDGKQLASINCESSVKLWNPETGALERRLAGHSYYIECVAYSRDGQTLATGGRDQVAVLWNVASGEILHTLRGHDDSVVSLDFSPDVKTLITADASAAIKIWDVSHGTEITHFRNASGVTAVRYSPDGRIVATAGGDDQLKL
jgi:hypothetical protein